MEKSEKDHARAAWRASQKKRGRKKVFVKPTENAGLGDLDSNLDRYAEDSDSDLEPGQVAPKSTGANLEALLAESNQDGSIFFRSRRLLDAEAEEALPAKALHDADQVLAIDYAALRDSLAQLPLHQLLGIEEEAFLGMEGTSGTSNRATMASSASDVANSRVEGAQSPAVDPPAASSSVGALQEAGGLAGGPPPDAEKGAMPKVKASPSVGADSRPGGQVAQDGVRETRENQAGTLSDDLDLDELLGLVEQTPGRESAQQSQRGRVAAANASGRGVLAAREPEKPAVKPAAPSTTEDLESWLDSL